MGYYTYYSLYARNIKDEQEYNKLIKTLTEYELIADNDHYGVFYKGHYDEISHTAHFSPEDEAKWYDHTYDMVKISKLFPDVIFQLSGEGEERDDMWHEYFHNGESEECRGHIVYDKPAYIEWEE